MVQEVSNREAAAEPARVDALDQAFEMWVHGGNDALAVHHGQPDGPAILPAGVPHTVDRMSGEHASEVA